MTASVQHTKERPMPEVLLIAHHTMKAGAEDEVLALVEELTDAVRAEPGNVSFDAYRSLREPQTYVLLERYASDEAVAAHRATPHFEQIVLGQLLPRLSDRTVEILELPDQPA
jgi:quinol monooxygenase YgiN